MQINHCLKTNFRENMNDWHSIRFLLIGAVATILVASSFANWFAHSANASDRTLRCSSIAGDGAKGGIGGYGGVAGYGGSGGKGPHSGDGGDGGNADGGKGGNGGRGGDATTLCILIAPNIYQEDSW